MTGASWRSRGSPVGWPHRARQAAFLALVAPAIGQRWVRVRGRLPDRARWESHRWDSGAVTSSGRRWERGTDCEGSRGSQVPLGFPPVGIGQRESLVTVSQFLGAGRDRARPVSMRFEDGGCGSWIPTGGNRDGSGVLAWEVGLVFRGIGRAGTGADRRGGGHKRGHRHGVQCSSECDERVRWSTHGCAMRTLVRCVAESPSQPFPLPYPCRIGVRVPGPCPCLLLPSSITYPTRS